MNEVHQHIRTQGAYKHTCTLRRRHIHFYTFRLRKVRVHATSSQEGDAQHSVGEVHHLILEELKVQLLPATGPLNPAPSTPSFTSSPPRSPAKLQPQR